MYCTLWQKCSDTFVIIGDLLYGKNNEWHQESENVVIHDCYQKIAHVGQRESSPLVSLSMNLFHISAEFLVFILCRVSTHRRSHKDWKYKLKATEAQFREIVPVKVE